MSFSNNFRRTVKEVLLEGKRKRWRFNTYRKLLKLSEQFRVEYYKHSFSLEYYADTTPSFVKLSGISRYILHEWFKLTDLSPEEIIEKWALNNKLYDEPLSFKNNFNQLFDKVDMEISSKEGGLMNLVYGKEVERWLM